METASDSFSNENQQVLVLWLDFICIYLVFKGTFTFQQWLSSSIWVIINRGICSSRGMVVGDYLPYTHRRIKSAQLQNSSICSMVLKPLFFLESAEGSSTHIKLQPLMAVVWLIVTGGPFVMLKSATAIILINHTTCLCQMFKSLKLLSYLFTQLLQLKVVVTFFYVCVGNIFSGFQIPFLYNDIHSCSQTRSLYFNVEKTLRESSLIKVAIPVTKIRF